jgi:hypothetical protein
MVNRCNVERYTYDRVIGRIKDIVSWQGFDAKGWGNQLRVRDS